MHSLFRRNDDADVIRARLRALLDDRGQSGGWVPEDEGDVAVAGRDVLAEPAPADRDELPRGIGRHRSPGPAVRWDPGPQGARTLWLAGLLAAVLLIGWTWLDRPRVEPVTPDGSGTTSTAPAEAPAEAPTGAPADAPAEGPMEAPAVGEVAATSTTVVVSVVGRVARPGLVTLPSGSRVADALEAAGGPLPGTDVTAINLAAVVSDGEQVAVGVPGPIAGAGPAAGDGADRAGGRVDLNTASAVELDGLPGIGPVLAERIVAHRTAQGPFTAVDQLDDVPGIGPAIAAELAELVGV